jgi:hypothetical protein
MANLLNAVSVSGGQVFKRGAHHRAGLPESRYNGCAFIEVS